MNLVDQFIRENIIAFPALYGNRTRVLHYVLCVVGNGYIWNSDGKIEYIPCPPSHPWNYESYLQGFKVAYEDLPVEVYEAAMSQAIKKADELQEIVNNADLLTVTPGKLDMEFYPQSEYSLLMQMPDNVLPDWKDACLEIAIRAVDSGWELPDLFLVPSEGIQ